MGLSIKRVDRNSLKRWRSGFGSELRWRQVSECRMWALGVVVVSPTPDFLAGVSDGSEPVKVQAFVPEFAVETLHEGVLYGLARRDEP